MSNTTNQFRVYRKKTPLTQEDLAFFLNLQGGALLSRCETGDREPSLEMVFVYHLLFDFPMLTYLNMLREKFRGQMLSQIPALIDRLSQGENNSKVQSRMKFLYQTINRLNTEPHDNESQ